MNGDMNNEIDQFNIFEVARNKECCSILKMILENLIIYNFHIDSQDEEGNTLLHLVVVCQDSEITRQLLALNPNLSIANNISETPLYSACTNGNLEAVKLLVEKGANLHVKDTKLRSLLHIGVENNNLELCKFLIDCGIDVNSQDYNGETPLHYAVDLKITKLTFLLVQKADVNQQDYEGYTPLHVAAKTRADLVKLLVLNNACRTIKTQNGDLPLHLAASSGNLEAVTVLLNGDGKRDSLNNANYTPVQMAEINGHKKILQLFSDNLSNAVSFGAPSKIPKAAPIESRIQKPNTSHNISTLSKIPPAISI